MTDVTIQLNESLQRIDHVTAYKLMRYDHVLVFLSWAVRKYLITRQSYVCT